MSTAAAPQQAPPFDDALVDKALLEEESYNRNPILVGHLREFPDSPNLDAGEGVRMMFGTMRETGLYPPRYDTRPHIERDAVVVSLFNENRPTLWEQVSQYVDLHGSIGNAEVRQLMGTEDVLSASKRIRQWVDMALLVVVNPQAGTKARRYAKPDTVSTISLFSNLER
jgi:ATP-dependent DNA helicase RecG